MPPSLKGQPQPKHNVKYPTKEEPIIEEQMITVHDIIVIDDDDDIAPKADIMIISDDNVHNDELVQYLEENSDDDHRSPSPSNNTHHHLSQETVPRTYLLPVIEKLTPCMEATVHGGHTSIYEAKNSNEEQESPKMVDNMDNDDDCYIIINAQGDDDTDNDTADISMDTSSTSSHHDRDDDLIIPDVDRYISDAMEVDLAEKDTDESNARTPDSDEVIDLTTRPLQTPQKRERHITITTPLERPR